LFAFNYKKRSDFIGLDISGGAIRLLQLSARHPRWLIKNYATARLPAAAIVNGKIQQPKLIQTELTSLVNTTQTHDCPVALALPAHAVISQQITLPPRLSMLEYEMTITAQLERYFPGVTDALCFDFLPVSTHAATHQEIFLVAARQWQVESYAALVNAAGLRVTVVDVDQFALLRAVPLVVKEYQPNHVVTLIHCGKDYAEIIIFSHQVVLLQQRWQQEDALTLVEVIKQGLQRFASQAQREVDYVVLAGELSLNLDALIDFFKHGQKLRIFYANPFTNMQTAKNIDQKKLEDDASNLLICCGLAIRKTKSFFTM
jgi:type IV pilus assembly protein PilM